MKQLLDWLFARLLSQSGQIPDGGDGGDEVQSDDQGQQSPDTGMSGDSGVQGGEAQPQQQASFFDPSQIDQLPVDDAVKAQLRQTWKTMHSKYNGWIQKERNPLQEKASIVDRFYSDRNFAQQTLVQWAAQNGYQLLPLGQQANAQAQAQQRPQARQGPQVPQALIEAAKASLPEELQWMAEHNAASVWAAQQEMMKPLQAHQRQQAQAQAEQQYHEAAAELREKAPDWEDRENDLAEMWDFLTSNQMRSPKFGNKLEMLWNMLTSNQSAVAEAANRMSRAVKNRSGSSIGNTRTVSNLQDRIKSAGNGRDAFAIAKQAALSQFGGD